MCDVLHGGYPPNTTNKVVTSLRFSRLEVADSLSKVVEELLSGDQQDFPVKSGPAVVGILPRDA